ncbi:MAG TPA: DUF1877 family protein [Labilithrix sp.]|nr:DUF1877 family protein [Labilithrix sp.]
MSITYRLCPLSAKRLAMIEADTDLVNDLEEGSVPDLLDLGAEGFYLDAILLFAGRDNAVRDAVFAQTGRDLAGAGEGIRVHTAERAAEVHAALEKLPADTIARHYEDARKAVPRLPRGPEAVERYTGLFERLREVYAKASASKSGMLTFMV